MAKEDVLEFYGQDDFYETEIEDGLTALACDINEAGDYALISDENGAFLEDLAQPVVFACYTVEGSFLWSVTFKNSRQFMAVWQGDGDGGTGVAAVLEYRSKQKYYE